MSLNNSLTRSQSTKVNKAKPIGITGIRRSVSLNSRLHDIGFQPVENGSPSSPAIIIPQASPIRLSLSPIRLDSDANDNLDSGEVADLQADAFEHQPGNITNRRLPSFDAAIQHDRAKTKKGKKRENKKKNTCRNEDVTLYCYADCEQGRRYDRSLVQCSMCMNWLHTICTDFDSTKNSIWMCKHCRCLPSNVDDLRLQLKEVHELLSRIFDSQNELYSNFCVINTRNFELQKEVKHLKKVNHELRMKCYNKLINDDSSSNSESADDGSKEISSVCEDSDISTFTPVTRKKRKYRKNRSHAKSPVETMRNVRQQKSKISVLGGSMVRNTGSELSKGLEKVDTCVYSISGLSITGAIKQAKSVFADHQEGNTTVLQVGTSDLPLSSKEKLTDQYDKLIDTAQHVAPQAKLIITAVPHRLDAGSANMNQKADFLNSYLRTKCYKNPSLFFIDANPEVIPENYREDGFHFSYKGRTIFSKYINKYISHSANFPKSISFPNP